MMNALGTEGICPICNHDAFVVGRLSGSGLTFTPQGEWPTATYPNWVNGRACRRCGYLQLFVELKPPYADPPLEIGSQFTEPQTSASQVDFGEVPSLRDRIKRASEEWFAENEP